ncbi:MAG: TolC family protein [Planctomycetota bacterium]|jgi:outer membrane protein TolC
MAGKNRTIFTIVAIITLTIGPAGTTRAQPWGAVFMPEQRRMQIREPAAVPGLPLPKIPSPPTVSRPQPDNTRVHLSLDEALRIALANSEVVRVVAGPGVTSSGSTVYDPAVTNTQIDRARARFDPSLRAGNRFDQDERREVIGMTFNDLQTERYQFDLGLEKTTTSGGTARLGVNANPLRTNPAVSVLNPETRSSLDLSYRHPLLKGGSTQANLAPIVLARIDTERSFYQLKDSTQQMVRGVIESYWAVVFARVDVWAREEQLRFGDMAYEIAHVRFKRGPAGERLGRARDRAQAQSLLASLQANLVTSNANLLQREATLRNILGLSPSDRKEIIPVSPPTKDRLDIDWDLILEMAQTYRPDLIQINLAIEADRQQLLAARNQALPQVDASALYRWDGLAGTLPNGAHVATEPGQFTGWQFGVDVTVPLGLRESRSEARRAWLVLMRDRANLEQALHNAEHLLADSYRNLARYYEQYQAFGEARKAARFNRDLQSYHFRYLDNPFLNVLQAIVSWGDSVDAEAQALLQYNTELARLAENTGTILEEHGVRFTEDGFCATGPAGRLFLGRMYPRDRRPGPNRDQYPVGVEPAEKAFDLERVTMPKMPPALPESLPPASPDSLPPALPDPSTGAASRSPALPNGLRQPAPWLMMEQPHRP